MQALTICEICSLNASLESKITPWFFTVLNGSIRSPLICSVHSGICFVWRSCAKTINSVLDSLRQSSFTNIHVRTSDRVCSSKCDSYCTSVSDAGFTTFQMVLSSAYPWLQQGEFFRSSNRVRRISCTNGNIFSNLLLRHLWLIWRRTCGFRQPVAACALEGMIRTTIWQVYPYPVKC